MSCLTDALLCHAEAVEKRTHAAGMLAVGKDSERVDELTYVWIDVVSPLHGFLVCSPPSGVNINMNMS